MLHNESVEDYVWGGVHISQCVKNVRDHLSRYVQADSRFSGDYHKRAMGKILAVSWVDESMGMLEDHVVTVGSPCIHDYA
jgi:hypothetical protein